MYNEKGNFDLQILNYLLNKNTISATKGRQKQFSVSTTISNKNLLKNMKIHGNAKPEKSDVKYSATKGHAQSQKSQKLSNSQGKNKIKIEKILKTNFPTKAISSRETKSFFDYFLFKNTKSKSKPTSRSSSSSSKEKYPKKSKASKASSVHKKTSSATTKVKSLTNSMLLKNTKMNFITSKSQSSSKSKSKSKSKSRECSTSLSPTELSFPSKGRVDTSTKVNFQKINNFYLKNLCKNTPPKILFLNRLMKKPNASSLLKKEASKVSNSKVLGNSSICGINAKSLSNSYAFANSKIITKIKAKTKKTIIKKPKKLEQSLGKSKEKKLSSSRVKTTNRKKVSSGEAVMANSSTKTSSLISKKIEECENELFKNKIFSLIKKSKYSTANQSKKNIFDKINSSTTKNGDVNLVLQYDNLSKKVHVKSPTSVSSASPKFNSNFAFPSNIKPINKLKKNFNLSANFKKINLDSLEQNDFYLSAKSTLKKSDITKDNNTVAKNEKNTINDNELNLQDSQLSTMKDSSYFRKEKDKICKYIKDFYKSNDTYPTTEESFYKIGRIIGRGAFGKVNIGVHICSGRLVAIKSFNLSKLKTSAYKSKLFKEIEISKELHSPFITKVLDTFETKNYLCIVMEYICGDLLSFIRKRGKLSEKTAKIIFKQIILGLQYMHSRRIVHRDIKLDNILIDTDNTVKICDFGVSRKLNSVTGNSSNSVTIMYEQCGTPAYLAPEIIKGKGYCGFSCDIWSAGVTLFYMLNGCQPFKGTKLEEIEKNIDDFNITNFEEEISEEARELIGLMLETNPRKRITVEEILGHEWLKDIDITNRHNLNLFSNAEQFLFSKYNNNLLSCDEEDIIETFNNNLNTLTNNESKNKLNCQTKSLILGPYNTKERSLYKKTMDIEIDNSVLHFSKKVMLANLLYELNNNNEFDNGMIITRRDEEPEEENYIKINASFSENKSLNNHLEEVTRNDNHEDTIFFSEILADIENNIGYKESFVIQSLKKNTLNYATACYYLLEKEMSKCN